MSIAVADRGIGIDEQHRKMLFHRFENFMHSDMMHPSSGIGLSMAREMVGRIKADRTVCHIPIIILSAKSSLDDRIVGLERGIDDYITKPFSATYLKTCIRTLIRRRQELQEFYRARFQPHPEETAAPADAESAPTAYEPKRPQLESLDDRFMEQVMECIEQNMDNQDFEIETLAEHLFMSRTVFYRKLKSITGMTPVAFVGEMRIKRALQLMEDDGLTISQVAYMTGFNSPKYFSKVFKKAVGCTPSEYKEQKKGDDE